MTQLQPRTPQPGPELDELLEEQRAIFAAVLALAQQQAALIEQGESSQLMAILAKRRQYDGLLEANQQRIAPYRAQWQQVVAAMSPAQRQQVRGVLEAIEQAHQQIMQIDRVDCAQLQKLLADNQAVRRKETAAGVASRAYAAAGVSRSISHFTDQQG